MTKRSYVPEQINLASLEERVLILAHFSGVTSQINLRSPQALRVSGLLSECGQAFFAGELPYGLAFRTEEEC